MNQIHVPCRPGEVSDGYHTFDELYEHRHALLLALMASRPLLSWFSLKHHDGTAMPGWFLAGVALRTGDISYHLPERLLPLARATGAEECEFGIGWDGHTPAQVVERLHAWVQNPCAT